ncbi:Hypothetical protein CAP_6658 [Chondromyces apiculatus DSM 436]|uniref:Uncharacterized protein n=1 Tax=Chondromyces apiculatus DSM 436 TaxID=1192034 RepID=A0A017T097_9BACT|nr:Hypothetical protein CAP_6658 [Chondromyces apiculatus DSM 436]
MTAAPVDTPGSAHLPEPQAALWHSTLPISYHAEHLFARPVPPLG